MVVDDEAEGWGPPPPEEEASAIGDAGLGVGDLLGLFVYCSSR